MPKRTTLKSGAKRMAYLSNRHVFRIIFFFLLFSLSAAAISANAQTRTKMNQTKTYAVAPGSFGGNGIIVTVEKNSVKIEYDCADGEILQSLKTDKKGYFVVDGRHKGPNAGPTRLND